MGAETTTNRRKNINSPQIIQQEMEAVFRKDLVRSADVINAGSYQYRNREARPSSLHRSQLSTESSQKYEREYTRKHKYPLKPRAYILGP
jgi:hypothetical protein